MLSVKEFSRKFYGVISDYNRLLFKLELEILQLRFENAN